MTIPNYVSTLYHKIEDKVRYAGKKTLDRVLETGNTLFLQSQLELALVGVTNNIGSQYGISNQYGLGDGTLFAKANGTSSKPIKRMGLHGASNNVYVDKVGGGRVIIRPINGKKRQVKKYVREVLDANGVDYTGIEVLDIVNKLKNPN